MTATLRTRAHRLLIAATLGASVAATAAAAPAHAERDHDLRISDLSRLCRQAGGELSGEGSIRPTCHDARLDAPATRRAAIACSSIGGTFTLSGDGRRGDWTCDVSAL